MIASALICLALNVYSESRGEPTAGQYAVAMVTLNRANFKNENVCEEVFRPKQFSWTNSDVKRTRGGWALGPRHIPKDKKAWAAAKNVAALAMEGRIDDFTDGSTYFHEISAKPAWRKKMQRVVQVGHHVFYKVPS